MADTTTLGLTGTEIPSREASFYTWEVAGKPVVVRIDFDVVDRLLKEIHRGFGLVPRRGVEMGGVLLGTLRETPGGWVAHVTDFESVPCSYSRGGVAYQLTEAEESRFSEVAGRWSGGTGQTAAIGFYRGHSREGLSVCPDDTALLDRYFPSSGSIILLVKPYATRVSQAGIFIREPAGMRVQSSYKEFPFHRRELGGEGGAAGATQGVHSRPESVRPEGPAPPAPRPGRNGSPVLEPTPPQLIHAPLLPEEKKSKFSPSGWIWLPLSFIFLMLGIFLGLAASLSVQSQLANRLRPDPFSIGLSVGKSNDAVHIRWDRMAAAVDAATRGVLTIHDGGAEREVRLDPAQLQNGSVIYRSPKGPLRVRMEIWARERTSLVETVDFEPGVAGQPAAAKAK